MINKKEFEKVLIDNDMSKKELADKLNKSLKTVNRWVNNETSPTSNDIVSMCKLLGIGNPNKIKKIFLN